MLTLTRTLKGLAAAALLVGLTTTAQAGDFVGMDSALGNLYSIDTNTNAATNLGSLAGAPPFGFGHIDRSPTGELYATSPGLIGGYTIYKIDQATMTATALHTISTNSSGNVGMAVDPSGNSVWVAGFVQLSLIVKVQEVDLVTGTMTERGQTGGNMWGLGFDGAGNLYTTVQGASNPQLIKVDKTNAANSTPVGSEMSGVDMMAGVDLSSDAGSGSLHVFSRNSDTLYSVDTTTGQATLVSALSGASTVFSVAEDNSCNLVVQYGTGCPGSGGFIPELNATGCPMLGNQITLEISNGLGGANALLVFGTGQGSLPMGAGCNLLAVPLLPAPQLILPLGGVGPSNGSLNLPGVIPPTLPPVTVTMQAFVFDSASPIGGSASNGLQLTIQ